MLDDAGIWSTVLWAAALSVLVYAGVLWVASIVWVAGDIQRRTDSAAAQFGAIAFAALFFLPGLVLYVALRPGETLADRAERQMEMQALAAQAMSSPSCTNCHRLLRQDFAHCPYCAWQVGAACSQCDRVRDSSWIVCPYCGESGDRAAVAQRSERGAAGTRTLRPSLVPVSVSAKRNGHAPAN